MLQEFVNRTPEELISEINPPSGWAKVEDPDNALINTSVNIDALKKVVAANLRQIAHNVELYIDRADKQYDVMLTEAYISIDDDSTFHIELLVNKNDFHAPKFIAAKIQANEMLTTTNNISMRHNFVVSSEYFRFQSTQTAYKLKYAYRVPVMEPADVVNTSDYRY